MEFERIEFTMEDILAIHQGWISELYVQERRTEAEIVAALSKQNLIVTLHQVQKCIRDWKLEKPLSASIPGLERFLSSHTFSVSNPERNPVNSRNVSSRQVPHLEPSLQMTVITTPPSASIPSSHYDQDRYIHRPLPPLPPPTDHTSFTHSRNYLSSSSQKKCRHGHEPNECMEARYCLNVLPHGPSSLRVYADTQEMHERISIGIFGTVGGDGGFLGPMQLVAVEVDHEVENQRLNGKKEMEKAEVFGEAIEPDSADESSDVTPDLKYYRAQDILRVRRRVERSTALRARHEKEKEKNGKDVCLERTVLEPGVDRKRKRETTPSIEDARDTRP